MTIVTETTTPPCILEPEVFHDDYLHNPPARHEVSRDEWQKIAVNRATAHRQCAGCPLMVECLYRAVVEMDVSGFVACTTGPWNTHCGNGSLHNALPASISS